MTEMGRKAPRRSGTAEADQCRLNAHLRGTAPPPVGVARSWLEAHDPLPNLPVLNLSQAAPADPPVRRLREAMREIIDRDPAAHIYGPVLGLPELRSEIADQWSRLYGGHLRMEHTVVTSGCNQGFTAAASVLAAAGERMLLTAPYYFNHKMWLDMMGIDTALIDVDAAMLPSLEHCAALIDDRVKAIVLVSPNNPTGAIYPPALLRAFHDLAKSRRIHLILDETYRDFIPDAGPPHDLFTDPDWDTTLVHLYSFSKAYRLTGHRIGAMAASPQINAQVEKFLDTVTICANQIGQRAALFGLRELGDWLAEESGRMVARIEAVRTAFAGLPDWRLLSSGAYFAYAQHPWRANGDHVARQLLERRGVLLLPGTMFAPPGWRCGQSFAEQQVRIAIANVELSRIAEAVERLRDFDLEAC